MESHIGIKKNMNLALKKYTNFESEEFEGMEDCITGCRVGLANLRRLCGGIGL